MQDNYPEFNALSPTPHPPSPSEERADLGTRQLGVRVIRLFSALPKRPEAAVIGKQVLRSGTSVGANFREAYRARSDAEFICKIGDCLKELDETCYWLELLVETEIVSAERLAALQEECHRLIAIFTTIVKKVKSNAR